MKLDEDLEFNKNEGQNKINMKFYEFILYCKQKKKLYFLFPNQIFDFYKREI